MQNGGYRARCSIRITLGLKFRIIDMNAACGKVSAIVTAGECCYSIVDLF